MFEKKISNIYIYINYYFVDPSDYLKSIFNSLRRQVHKINVVGKEVEIFFPISYQVKFVTKNIASWTCKFRFKCSSLEIKIN